MTAMHSIRNFRALVVLLVASLLTVFTTDTFGQTINVPNPTATTLSVTETSKHAQEPTVTVKATKRTIHTKDKSKLAVNNQAAWEYLETHACAPAARLASPPECVDHAILLVNSTCAAASNSYQKGSKGWQTVGFSLILASAAFTGIGAAATIAGSTTVPKIFSTLGGTTGLGAVTATVNSNASGDMAGSAAVNAVMSDFQTYLLKGGTSGTRPVADQIYPYISTYATQCLNAVPTAK